MKGLSL